MKGKKNPPPPRPYILSTARRPARPRLAAKYFYGDIAALAAANTLDDDERGTSMHVTYTGAERERGEEGEVLLACLAFNGSHIPLFRISPLARGQPGRIRKGGYCSWPVQWPHRHAPEFLGAPFSYSPDRQTYHRINFIPTRYHRRPSPIPTSPLSLSSHPLHSIFLSIHAVSSDSIRPKQSKFQPQQRGRRCRRSGTV